MVYTINFTNNIEMEIWNEYKKYQSVKQLDVYVSFQMLKLSKPNYLVDTNAKKISKFMYLVGLFTNCMMKKNYIKSIQLFQNFLKENKTKKEHWFNYGITISNTDN